MNLKVLQRVLTSITFYIILTGNQSSLSQASNYFPINSVDAIFNLIENGEKVHLSYQNQFAQIKLEIFTLGPSDPFDPKSKPRIVIEYSLNAS